MNNIVLIGRLVRDPELRFLTNGNNTAVARFSLAVDRQLSKDKKEEMESKGLATCDFINIVVWGKLAESCNNYLAKGRLVGIRGRLQTGSYEKYGEKKYSSEVVADEVQFLEWGDSNNKEEQTPVEDMEGFYQVNNDDIPF